MVYLDHGSPEAGLITFTRLFRIGGGGYGIGLPCGDFFSIKQLHLEDPFSWGAFQSRKQVASLTLGIHKKKDKLTGKYILIPVIQGPYSLCYLVVMGNPPSSIQGRRPVATAYWSQGPIATIARTP